MSHKLSDRVLMRRGCFLRTDATALANDDDDDDDDDDDELHLS